MMKTHRSRIRRSINQFAPANSRLHQDFGGQAGQAALIAVTLMLFAMVALVAAAATLALGESKISELDFQSNRSYFLAEAGLEDALYRVLRGKNVPSSYSLALYGQNTNVTVSDVSGQKEITSVSSIGSIQRAGKISLKSGIGVSFHYGAQVGYLGLDMQNQGQIIGSVYSNGNITADQNTAITGDAWVAAGTGLVADQAQTIQTHDLNVRDVSSRRDAAQSFVPSVTAEVRKVRLYIKRTASSPPDATVRIVKDEGGKPDDAGSYANGNLNASLVTTSYGWVDVTMNSNDPILQGETYWIVIDNSGYNATKYYIAGGADDSGYSAGTFLYSQDWSAASPVWNPPAEGARDLTFQIYLGTVTTSIAGATIGQNATGDAHAGTVTNSTVAGTIYCQIGSGNNKACDTSLPDPSPQNFPISQGIIDQFKADGDAGGVCSPSGVPPNPNASPQCDSDGDFQLDHSDVGVLGPIKIPRNLDLDNNAVVTIKGTVHVGGDLKLKNQCVVKLDSSYGSSDGVIVVDGIVDIDNQCDILGSGDPDSYIMIITTSQQISGPPAIRLSNSSSGVILYASEGAAQLENQAGVKEVTAQRLVVKNQATVTYESGLENLDFSSGPSGGWEINSWEEIVP